jgi:hypothetical protein
MPAVFMDRDSVLARVDAACRNFQQTCDLDRAWLAYEASARATLETIGQLRAIRVVEVGIRALHPNR